MAETKPYTISVPQDRIDRLKRRLDLAEFPVEKDDAGWQYGSPVSDIKRIVEYWKTRFDWRSHEHKLNSLPNYEIGIDVEGHGTIDVHLVHQKSTIAGAIPLLFLHGWPGSFLEVTKLLPLLKGGDGKPAFHVVAPSLPNHGFSGPALKSEFNVRANAEAMHKLMLALGYSQYVVQGGDMGFVLARVLAHVYPEHVKAHHINWVWAAKPAKYASGGESEPEYNDREKKQMAMAAQWDPFGYGDGRGYIVQMSTKPATINFALRDSPVALLAWIYEKLVSWSDEYPWTDDEVCLWASIYVFARAGGADAATYAYYEALHGEVLVGMVQSHSPVPLGIADFPVEISNSPVAWRDALGPIVFQEFYPKGGHFAAWEQPQSLADGLCQMFGKGGGAHGVVDGKSGY